MEETPEEDVRSLMDVNFFGSLNVLRGILPILRRRQGGHIVQISSLAGIAPPAAGLGAYAASKFAVEGMLVAVVTSEEAVSAPSAVRVPVRERGDQGSSCPDSAG
ncbi:SDR family NAD(P)-dependent oxidoreductase [Galactobacter caseinivorans]|uniref:SDR family NAD(P)-dependent oxidoreductase n=1 Tax=Galactobacter caseinivorans TaxID=2676123 RepID=UPI003898D675